MQKLKTNLMWLDRLFFFSVSLSLVAAGMGWERPAFVWESEHAVSFWPCSTRETVLCPQTKGRLSPEQALPIMFCSPPHPQPHCPVETKGPSGMSDWTRLGDFAKVEEGNSVVKINLWMNLQKAQVSVRPSFDLF